MSERDEEMTQKPKPKDYPFNYWVQWTEHDWEDFPSYREAERAIRQRFPVAFIETEWDSSLHTKFVFRDPLTAREVMDADDWYEDALERCVAQIERRRDAYESALTEWEVRNVGDGRQIVNTQSDRRTAMSEPSQMPEFVGGKPLRDCTMSDLIQAAKLSRKQAARMLTEALFYERLARSLRNDHDECGECDEGGAECPNCREVCYTTFTADPSKYQCEECGDIFRAD